MLKKMSRIEMILGFKNSILRAFVIASERSERGNPQNRIKKSWIAASACSLLAMTTRCLAPLRLLIMTVILSFSTPTYAVTNVFEWMTTSILGLLTLLQTCIEVPPYGNFRTGSQILNLANSGVWVDTGVSVQQGKMIQFDWSTIGVTTRPRKHLVLYRVDPRFARPQVFIQTYDWDTGQYVSDFHQFKGGQLLRYQADPLSSSTAEFDQRRNDYTDYFNFVGRDKIPVYAGDVINITLTNASGFFTPSDGPAEFSSELDPAASNQATRPLTVMYTPITHIADNKMIYANYNIWCVFANSSVFASDITCDDTGFYNKGALKFAVLVGMDICPFPDRIPSLADCADSASDMNQSPLCLYSKGKGMLFTLNGSPIKPTISSLIYSPVSSKYFFYYKAAQSGSLDFTTDWQINDMFVQFPQFMSDWNWGGDAPLMFAINSNLWTIFAKFLHFGRYFMSLEIGSGDSGVSFDEQNSITVEYTIATTQPPSTFSGTEVDKTYKADAGSDGYIWLRVINPLTQVQGSVTVKYAAYTGTTIFSDIVYNKLIQPLTAQFQSLSQLVYTKLVTNATVQGIARTLLALYVAVYALWFIAGATQVTMQDVIVRVIKITIIVTLFSANSWNFFNYYLFETFTLGMSYFIGQVVNASSSTEGMFGFIDPIFDRYTNPTLWGLLLIQLLQIHNGLAFFSIMTIYSMLTFFRGVLEIIIGYCLAFIGLTVMISLAPFFITLMLFEKTQSIFDNWISSLFNYMIQPTILLIFFLLIDQLIGRQITDAITEACIGILIPLEIALDLRNLGIPLDISFSIPFLPGIPFFVPNVSTVNTIDDVFIVKGSFLFLVTSTLLLYCYCTMARGLVEYVSTVSSMLTNVLPARQEGKFQKSANATSSIISDIGGLFNPVKSAAGVFKDKVIDQNYKARKSNIPDRKEDTPTHVGKVFKSRYDGQGNDDGGQRNDDK
jgi:type IV secretion system protein VirB6